MSYNGIGLSTPRGSGTSGHIQANRSNIRSRQQFDKQQSTDFRAGGPAAHRQPDQSILDHERKRRIEAKCFELQVQLEDEGLLAQDQIELKVDELRQSLLAQADSGKKEGLIRPSDRHELARAKIEQDEKFRKALGIKDGHVEGLAFDRDAQAEIKRQKHEEREKAKEERAKIQADLERAREQAHERRREHERQLDRERADHEAKMRRERKQHEDKMQQDRIRMEQELEARRNGLPPTAETRDPRSIPVALAFAFSLLLVLAFSLEVSLAPSTAPFVLVLSFAFASRSFGPPKTALAYPSPFCRRRVRRETGSFPFAVPLAISFHVSLSIALALS
ncbi:U2-type spliceosomal complex subunit CWC21 [Sporobolomyces koalae]|uniref:U2-type spliceosomal complex subunit CWC21 n=1 Tax=Sporobolomyces koalae TaxID=500713 RepID=UPI003171E201